MRSALGSTVSFASAARTIGPLSIGRVTLNVDVHQSLEVDKESLRPVLPVDLMAKIDREPHLLTLRRLGEILGLPVYRSAPAVGDGPTEAVAEDSEEEGQDEEEDTEAETASEQQPSLEAGEDDEPVWKSRNVIFFGPPGTGKSFRLDQMARTHLRVKSEERILRVTFHPEYTYFDFVGNYRPAVGWLENPQAVFRPEKPGAAASKHEPRVYYEFDPGPLSRSLALAANSPKENVVLIIEEINRGNCAAIFGDVFQLLDRKGDRKTLDEYASSQYPVNASGAWATWLDQHLPKGSTAWRNGQLRLPGNLYLYATMNTSDQSLFPMDTAFRRRWNMEYVGIASENAPPTLVPIEREVYVPWAELLKAINRRIVEHTNTDDKQVGPWFVRAADADLVNPLEFASKVLFYLWSDVFRDAPEKLFRDHLQTYDQLVQDYLDRKPVFREEIRRELSALAPAVEQAPGTTDQSDAASG